MTKFRIRTKIFECSVQTLLLNNNKLERIELEWLGVHVLQAAADAGVISSRRTKMSMKHIYSESRKQLNELMKQAGIEGKFDDYDSENGDDTESSVKSQKIVGFKLLLKVFS